MLRLLYALAFTLALLLVPAPAMAQQATLDAAVTAAVNTFEAAWPQLGGANFGVDGGAYRDALTLQAFTSSHWGGAVRVELVTSADADGSCGRFAACTRMPPANGSMRLVLCPQFFTEGADALRELTILHEMVHVVAGGDECRAMAYAARVQQLAHGTFTPVDRYWQANHCPASQFRLP